MLLSVSNVLYAQDELCTDGILLFHEDFGGNDPSDPAVGRTAVSGMSSGYQQIYKLQTSDPGTGFGAGCYLVAKRGYRNSTNSNYSVWHIMDDHTYFGDTTRGYFLEIDGKGSGNDVFYSTVIDGLCEGSRLTFSAYVANLTTAGQYNAWRSRNYVHPKLSFVLTNPQTGAELARYNTDTISHDWSNYPKSWRETADWQLIGMNFTVPEGIDSVRLSIRNNASGSSTGNDFALDDIEIHLCMPPIHVNGVQEACPGEAVTLGSELDYPYMVYEALYYKWWYSPDSLNWTEIDYGIDHFQLNIPDAGSSDSGWYKVAMGTEGRMDNDNCHTTSEPFRLTVKDCGTPEPPVTVTIVSPDSVCPNDPYTFEVNIENGEQLEEPVEYQWWYRSPEYPTVWNKVSGGNLRDLQISSFKTQHVGWYKVMVAGNGGIRDEDMRVESEEYFVTFKKCEPDLCLDGTLLYRDDFGGNDPNDPRVGTDPVSGMAYSQSTNDRFGQMGNGRYIVTKTGYCNGDTAALRSQSGYVPGWGSQWILQDDHTYPNDRTRGYYVEIDGSGGNTPFYSTTIDGLCPGSKLTFSAYVVNVHFYEQVQKFYRVGRYNYVYPRMKFVLKDPQNGQTLATQSTGDIQPDVTKSWNIFLNESAEWQLVGMEFTVPEGVESIQMYIYNDVGYGTGNDFAIDDIEIHLCAPSVTIEGEPEFCVNETATLSADFTNDGTFEEPLVYKWWHSTDSVTWIEMTDFIGENPVINAVQKADSGWYKVAVAGNGNIENVNCRAVSEPFRLTVKECTPSAPDLCMDGILLFREDFGGNEPEDSKISTTPVSGMSYQQQTSDHLGIMQPGSYLVTKQGYQNGTGTSQWHIQDDHTHPGDYTRGYFMEIDGRSDNAAFYQTTIDHLCEGIELTFSAYVANVMTWGMYIGRPGVYAYPRLNFVLTNPQDNSELATYDTGDIPFDSAFIGDNMCWQQSVQWRLVGMNFTVPVGVESIQLSIYNNVSNSNGNDFAIDDIEIHLCMTPDTIRTDTIVCDTISQILWHEKTFAVADTLCDTLFSSCGFDSIYYIMKVDTKICCPDLHYATHDTIVCDTLMPYTWHGLLFDAPGSQTTVEKDERGCDTLQTTWTLNTKICCPDLLTITLDTTVCDTLLPFTWRGMVFEVPTEMRIMEQSPRGCDSIEHVYRLDTFHCERLYPIIVNKYNWQLLCHNVRVRELFPELMVTGYQWYKDGTAIPNATEDDYSEQNELQGEFQLRLHMSDGRYVWSEILTIQPGQTQAPSRIRIYNHNGYLFYQSEKETTIPSLPRGLYIIQIEQNGEQRIEKKLIP